MTGFSLSLTLEVTSFWSDTSFLLVSRCFLLAAGCTLSWLLGIQGRVAHPVSHAECPL
jgi:hypothetical protein